MPATASRPIASRRTPSRRTALLAAVVALAPVAVPATAGAQAWRDQITRQLDNSSLVASARRDGYVVSFGPSYQLVGASARTEVPVELEGGRAYRFIGKCDNDCSDLDLRVYDPDDDLVASDIATDDAPIVSLTAARSGRYVLVVTMASCSTSSCGWGVVGFARGAGRTITPLATSSSSSASGWRDQVARQLASSSIVASLKRDGYAESHAVFYDLVERGASTSVSLPLEAGRSYQLIGKCDNDCSDLDFHLYDAGDELVDSDVQTDDVPVVRVTPRRSGTYRLRVTMASCSVSRCGWGVMVLAR